MQTILIIGLAVATVIFLIAWITSMKQKEKAEKQFVKRIQNGDKTLQEVKERNEHLVEQNELLGESTVKLNAENEKIKDEKAQLEQWYKDAHNKTVELKNWAEELKEELRVTKGNATRFRNRDKFNKKVIESMAKALEDQGIKYVSSGVHNGKFESKFELIPAEASKPQPAPDKCNCMNPIKGVGNRCKKCKKQL